MEYVSKKLLLQKQRNEGNKREWFHLTNIYMGILCARHCAKDLKMAKFSFLGKLSVQ